MTRHAIRPTVRWARHHPRRALRIGLVTGSAIRMTSKVAYAKRHAGRVAELLKRAATDRRIHVETRRARADASRAARRVRRVGVTGALTDKRVARELRRASRHASKAAHLAVRPRRHHRTRTAANTLVGTGVLAGAAYGGWKTYSPAPESGRTVTPKITRPPSPRPRNLPRERGRGASRSSRSSVRERGSHA